jgi:hypothetical protein
MLKLILNVITSGIEAFVVSGNKFLYTCAKMCAACELSHVLTPSIKSTLSLKFCNFIQFFR